MPVLHIYSGHLNQIKKGLFATEATDVIVKTLGSNSKAVKIFFHEYSPENFAGDGVIDKDAEVVDVFQCNLQILEGRTKDQHRECVKQLSSLAVDFFEVDANKVRIYLQEMPKDCYSIGGIFVSDGGQ